MIGDPSYFQDKVKKVGQVSFIMSQAIVNVWNKNVVALGKLYHHRSHSSNGYNYSVAKTSLARNHTIV